MRDMAQVGLVPRPTVSHGGRKAVVLFTLCLGVFIAQADTSVVNLAIQSIGGSFVASVTALQWVLDTYNFTYATLLLIGDLYGRPLIVAQIGLILAGIGMGLYTGPLTSIAVDVVSAARSGTASALINVARMTGATLGVVFLGTAFALWRGGAEGPVSRCWPTPQCSFAARSLRGS